MVTEQLMSFAELSSSIGAEHHSFSSCSGFSSVALDSRNVKEGGIFIALNGEKCDGHTFVEKAFENGAAAAMVEASKIESFNLIFTAKKMNKDLIAVNNTMKGLQDAARVYLEKFPHLVKVAITGSCGKTTTKNIAYSIVSCEKNTVINPGNLNSETGLPLSIFDVRSHHEAGIFEMGMNRPGEIAELAEIVKPNIALITNIGTAHIEFFGSKEKILKEKKCIFNFLRECDTALIPQKDEYAKALAENVKGKVRFYGEDTFSELEKTLSLGLDGSEIYWSGEKIHFALAGKHSLDDAVAAIAIAKELSIGNASIKKGLESVKPLFGRLEILKGKGITVIRDCYNANPESTAKSIEFCDMLEDNSRRLYVIGDMLELGDASKEEHEKLGNILLQSKAEKVFLFGKETKAASSVLTAQLPVLQKQNKSFYHTENIDELSASLDSFLKEGDIVLLKGSRGCALERLSSILLGEENAA